MNYGVERRQGLFGGGGGGGGVEKLRKEWDGKQVKPVCTQ